MAKQLQIPFHPKQAYLYHQIIVGHKRNVAICCGRQWGKTKFCTLLCLIILLQKTKKIAYICPTHALNLKVMRDLKQELLNVDQLAGVGNKSEKTLTSKSGSTITFFSTNDNPDIARGFNFDLIIIDEAALVSDLDTVVNKTIPAMVMATGGITILISTPRGLTNAFFRIYNDWTKEAVTNKEYFTFTGTSYDNVGYGIPSRSEIDRYLPPKRPEYAFNEEFLAIPASDSGMVFGDVTENFIDSVSTDLISYFGMDIAYYPDYTAIAGFNGDNHVVYFNRFHSKDSNELYDKIYKSVYQHIPIEMDYTAIGRAVYDKMLSDRYKVIDFKFTKKSKPEMIVQLQQDIALKNLKIWKQCHGLADGCEIIKNEMYNFEYKTNETGYKSYNARPGEHDDAIAAIGLGNWFRHERNMGPQGLTSMNDVIIGEAELRY